MKVQVLLLFIFSFLPISCHIGELVDELGILRKQALFSIDEGITTIHNDSEQWKFVLEDLKTSVDKRVQQTLTYDIPQIFAKATGDATSGVLCVKDAVSEQVIYYLESIRAELLTGVSPLAYERFIDETELSIQGKASVAYRNIVLWDAVQPKYFGYSLELQARFYFIIYERQVPNGLYLGLFGKYSHKNATLKTASSKITFIDGFGKTIGLLTGWQHRFQKSMSRFVFDFNFGGGYQFADFSGRFSEKGKLISFLDSGIVPKIDFMVGFNF